MAEHGAPVKDCVAVTTGLQGLVTADTNDTDLRTFTDNSKFPLCDSGINFMIYNVEKYQGMISSISL